MAITGFIAQIHDIERKGLAPILIMDEALSQVSRKYIPNLMRFINRIAEKEGFIFILITHDTRFIDYATSSYVVEKGNFRLIQQEEVDSIVGSAD